jgi:eukaryotic-like serine/threonine-protein kinase
LRATSVVLTTILFLAVTIAEASASDWPMIQRDPTHSGFSESGPAPPLRKAWKIDAGDPESNFTTWPVVFDGVSYASVGPGVVAVDAGSGSRKWLTTPPEGQTIVGPAVDNKGLYIPVPFGRMLALDRQTGTELWRFQADDKLEASPTLADGRLYFGSAQAKTFYCIDVQRGQLVWKAQLELEPNSVPVVSDGLVVFSVEDLDSENSLVLALDAATGREVWRVRQQENNSSPSILGDKVIIGGGDLFVYALDLKTGRRVWRTEVPGKFHVRNSPAIAYGDVFMADRVGNLYRLDGDTGKMKWIFDDTEGTFDQSYPVIAGKTFYIGGGAGWLYALNADTGKLLWKDKVGGFVMSGAADAERFYFGVKFRNEGLYAYEHNPDPKAGTDVKEDEGTGASALPKVIFGALVILSLVLAGVILGLRIFTKRLSKKLP